MAYHFFDDKPIGRLAPITVDGKVLEVYVCKNCGCLIPENRRADHESRYFPPALEESE